MFIKGKYVTWSKISRNQLKHLILDEGLADWKIAQLFGVTKSQVRDKRTKFKLTEFNFTSYEDAFRAMLEEIALQWFLDRKNLDVFSKSIVNYIFSDGPNESLHQDMAITNVNMEAIKDIVINRISELVTFAVERKWMTIFSAIRKTGDKHTTQLAFGELRKYT